MSERMLIWARNADYVVSFPDGAYTNAANFWLAAVDGRSVTIDGSGTVWVMPGSDDGQELYDAQAIRVQSNERVGLFRLDPSKAEGAFASHALSEMRNFRFTVVGSATNPAMTFDGGSYDFRDPAGESWSSEKKPLLVLCEGNGEATGTYDVTFRNGVSLRAWDLALQAGARQGGRVLLDGGNYYVEALQMPNTTVSYANAYETVSEMTLTNGASFSAASVAMGNRKGKSVKLCLRGPGTLFESRGALSAAKAGCVDLDLGDGAEMRLGGDATIVDGEGTFQARIAHARLEGQNVTIGSVASAEQADRSRAGLSLRNSTVELSGMLALNNVAEVTAEQSSLCLGSLALGNRADYGARHPAFVLASGAVTSLTDVAIAKASSCAAELTLKGGVFVAARHVSIGGSGSGSLTVAGGVFDNCFTVADSVSPSPTPTVAYLGQSSTASKGTLNVTGGEARFRALYAGMAGASEINVSGGRLSCRDDLRIGSSAPSGVEHVLTQTGGEIHLPFDLASNLGGNPAAHVRLALNGGCFTVKSLQAGNASAARGGTGRVTLEANGGTLVAYADSADFIRNFDEASLASGGLVIDTAGHDVTLQQTFTGSGTLTLTGGGTVRFASGLSLEGPVKVAGDTCVSFNGLVPNGLSLGDATGAASLDWSSGETIVVKNGALAIDGTVNLLVPALSAGATAEVFRVVGTVSSETAGRWAMVAVSAPSESMAYEPVTFERGGQTILALAVREARAIGIEVGEGVRETHESNVVWSVNDRLTATVGAGGEMRMDGWLGRGYLIKDGLGTLTLANPASQFANGVLFRLGTLAFDFPDGATVDWSLVPSAASETDALNVLSIRSLWIRELSVQDGRGTLAFATSGQIGLGIPVGTGRMLSGVLCASAGETVLRGATAEPGVLTMKKPGGAAYAVLVGSDEGGASSCSRAGLVIDNVTLTGSVGLATDLTAESPVQETYIVVSNKGVLAGNGTVFGNNGNPNARALIRLDDGTLRGQWTYNMYGRSPMRLEAVHGSRVYGARLQFRGGSGFRLDDSVLAADDKGNPAIVEYFSNWDFTNEFEVVNGAVFNVSALQCGVAVKYAYPANVSLTFDDAEWTGMADGDYGHRDPHAGQSRNPNVRVFVRGAGLRLDVPEGETYSWSYPLADSPDAVGGFVKRGGGTLKVEKVRQPDLTTDSAFAFGQTGVTVVEAGTLDLDGNVWFGGTLGGGDGRIANGTLRRGTIALDLRETDEGWSATATPLLAATLAVRGRMRIDLGEARPPVGAAFVVARYEGAAPDVSSWRLLGSRDVTIACVARDGEIVAQIAPPSGTLLLVR